MSVTPSRALACDPSIPAPGAPPPAAVQDDSELHWGLAFAVGGAVNATFVGLQLASIGDMFPPWLAAIELGVGVSQTIFAVLLTAASTLGYSSCGGNHWVQEGEIASGLMFGVGGWLIAHAIWSFADGADPELQPTFAASSDGALVGVVGTF